jgi:hypothetical protein
MIELAPNYQSSTSGALKSENTFLWSVAIIRIFEKLKLHTGLHGQNIVHCGGAGNGAKL